VLGAGHAVAIARGRPREGEDDVGAALVASQVHVLERERAAHGAFVRRAASRRGEEEAAPGLALEELDDRGDARPVAILHMHGQGLAAAREDHVLAVGFHQLRVPELLRDVHVVHGLREAVVGDHDDVGALLQAQVRELFQQRPDLGIVPADRRERFGAAGALGVLDVVRAP
jgi:hypothetical protein